MRKIDKVITKLIIVVFLWQNTGLCSDLTLRVPIGGGLMQMDQVIKARHEERASPINFEIIIKDKRPYVRAAALQNLIDKAAENTQIGNNPAIAKAFYTGSALCLVKNGLIPVDRVRDLDLVLIFAQPEPREDAIRQKFIEELAKVLDETPVDYRLETISLDLLDIAAKYGLKKEGMEAQKSLSLVIPGGNEINVEMDTYASSQDFVKDEIITLRNQLNHDDLLSQDAEITIETEQDARFIKRYLKIEYLIGDPKKYLAYRDGFLRASPEGYMALRQAIVKGELGRLRTIIRKSRVSDISYALLDKLCFFSAESLDAKREGFLFPVPVSSRENPWNIEAVGGGVFSYLNRYPKQTRKVGELILPVLFRRHQRDKKLSIAVIGPATGEEMATNLAAVIQALETRPEGDAVEDWGVSIEGIESDFLIALEGESRLRGEQPFVYEGTYHTISDHIKLPYMGGVKNIMDSLNRYREWAVRSFEIRIGDAKKRKTLEWLKDKDIIFINSSLEFDNLEEVEEFAAILKEVSGSSFIVGSVGAYIMTEEEDVQILEGLDFIDTHSALEINNPPLEMTSSILIPRWAESYFGNLPEIAKRLSSVTPQDNL